MNFFFFAFVVVCLKIAIKAGESLLKYIWGMLIKIFKCKLYHKKISISKTILGIYLNWCEIEIFKFLFFIEKIDGLMNFCVPETYDIIRPSDKKF